MELISYYTSLEIKKISNTLSDTVYSEVINDARIVPYRKLRIEMNDLYSLRMSLHYATMEFK